MFEEMYKEKARFVKKLQNFYIRDCRNIETIKRLDYVHDEDAATEFIYVSYTSHSQKRIYVTGSNEQGMLIAFCHYLDHFDSYYWLNPNEAAFRSEFLEDEK